MAQENPRWGYTRLRDALAHLGHEIARNTVKRILQKVSAQVKGDPCCTYIGPDGAGKTGSDPTLLTMPGQTIPGLRSSRVRTSSRKENGVKGPLGSRPELSSSRITSSRVGSPRHPAPRASESCRPRISHDADAPSGRILNFGGRNADSGMLP